jgi:hypothetical protein
MTLYSTCYAATPDSKQLNEKTLTSLATRASEITLLSAYYSGDFISNLLDSAAAHNRRDCIIRMVVNGFLGERLNQQLNELKAIKREYKECGDLAIYLNHRSALFHSKLYPSKTRKRILPGLSDLLDITPF